MRATFLMVLAGLCTTPLAAQDTYGGIEGRVETDDGDPLDEVQVTVSGPGLQLPRQVTTGRSGAFRFLALPVGTYDLTVRAVGRRPVAVAGVQVRLGMMTAAQVIRLAPAQAVELAPIDVAGWISPRRDMAATWYETSLN